MSMDGMTMKTSANGLSHVECDVNTSDDATKDCVQCAQCCNLCKSTCVASFTLLSTMRSPMLEVCLWSYTLFRSHLSLVFVREFLYQEVLYLHYDDLVVLNFLNFFHIVSLVSGMC